MRLTAQQSLLHPESFFNCPLSSADRKEPVLRAFISWDLTLGCWRASNPQPSRNKESALRERQNGESDLTNIQSLLFRHL